MIEHRELANTGFHTQICPAAVPGSCEGMSPLAGPTPHVFKGSKSKTSECLSRCINSMNVFKISRTYANHQMKILVEIWWNMVKWSLAASTRQMPPIQPCHGHPIILPPVVPPVIPPVVPAVVPAPVITAIITAPVIIPKELIPCQLEHGSWVIIVVNHTNMSLFICLLHIQICDDVIRHTHPV